MQLKKDAQLVLEDGSVFFGFSFGSKKSTAGEVVFSTGMVGYPESMTDPSFKGQILCITYPLIGNYGVPSNERDPYGLPKFFESDSIHVQGLVISDYSHEFSHWNAKKSLSQWMQEQDIPGIYGIDTRALTKLLRDKGCMLGKIIVDNEQVEWYDPNKQDIVKMVTVPEPIVYDPLLKKTTALHNSIIGDKSMPLENESMVAVSIVKEATNKKTVAQKKIALGQQEAKQLKNEKKDQKTIVLVDCGAKHNIVRCFLKRDVKVIRVPYDYDFTKLEYDGLMISNGPGDPKECKKTIQYVQKALTMNKPIFGICLGNQLLALAAGGDTYKLKFGHRSQNQPCIQEGTKRCFITTQNHGFAVNTKKLPSGWKPYFTNANDGTNEGIKHVSKPFFSVQFHPEATPGPVDSEFLFDEFIRML